MRRSGRGEESASLLRQVLENLKTPDRLDGHPWAESLTVQEYVGGHEEVAGQGAGTQLALTMGGLFGELMPVTPPQDGKRLDTRWGRFGILAANYFAPLCFGRMYPHNLREAWRRIDQAILLFVYGKTADELTAEQVNAYRLIGDDGDFAANSTISDWHRDGVEALADLFVNHEKHLRLAAGTTSTAPGGKSARRWWTLSRGVLSLVLLGVTVGLVSLGVKGWQIYRSMQLVRRDLTQLASLSVSSLESADMERAGPLLVQTHGDIEALRTAVAPWSWLSDNLGWVPEYGGDLKYAGDLLEVASNATASASLVYQSSYPIWKSVQGNPGQLKGTEMAGLLLYVQPALVQAQAELAHAVEVRQRIEAAQLSPEVRSAVQKADTYFEVMDEGLSLATSLPRLLGAAEDGPKTYLILIQNEDELRPTGGFITAVGKLVVWNGELISWDIVDSYTVDDANKAYPRAPWQMQSFMNIPIMTFRDANWYPDYPTTVKWAEYLYAYTNSYSVNGVIAIDQHVLKALLSVTGPLRVDEINETVTADNVQEVMRAQKVPPADQVKDPTWYRKQFLNPIAEAVLNRVLSGPGMAWGDLIQVLMGELDQRHILLQLDDPTAAKLVDARGWNGSVRRSGRDFLMVVDTNVGYNKTNAVVKPKLAYDVDLTNLAQPTSRLQVFEQNDASGESSQCNQRPAGVDRSTLEYWYAIDRCYYDYLRVYVPSGTVLVNATPHAVTRDEMIMLDRDVPGRVDNLDDRLAGLRGFGTLLVVPMGGSLETDFEFRLPAGIVQHGPGVGELTYALRIQKQAGTVATPISVRIQLPQGARIGSVTPGGYVESGGSLRFDLELKMDITIEIRFEP